jgi:signal transduction histidine kinase
MSVIGLSIDRFEFGCVIMTEKYSDRVIRVEAVRNIAAIADRDRLKQVLINLVDNAVKYSDAEQPIILSIDRLDGQAIIRVRDRGVGIPLQDRSRSFERFYQVDEARARRQAGMDWD